MKGPPCLIIAITFVAYEKCSWITLIKTCKTIDRPYYPCFFLFMQELRNSWSCVYCILAKSTNNCFLLSRHVTSPLDTYKFKLLLVGCAEKQYTRDHEAEKTIHVTAFYISQPALRSQTFTLLTIGGLQISHWKVVNVRDTLVLKRSVYHKPRLTFIN